jgi:hypothetical protein
MRRLLFLILLCLGLEGVAQAAISRDGSCSGTTSCTFSGTATNSLKIVWAFRNASATAPSLPSGWTTITSFATGSSGSIRIGCNVSSSGSDTGSGTWTNATNIGGISFSGTAVGTTGNCNTTGVNANGQDGKAECATVGNCSATTSTTASFRGITTSSGSGTSWVAAGLGGSAASVCTPTGMTAQSTTSDVRVMDSNGTVTGWNTTTCTVSSETWMTYVVEVLAASPACSSCAPTLIQRTLHGMQNNSNDTTWKMNIFDPVSAGNCILIAGQWGSSTVTAIVTDDKNNTYKSVTAQDGTNGQSVGVFYACNVAANTQFVTVTMSAAVTGIQFDGFIYSNLATANVVDVSQTATAIASGTCAPSSMTTTVNNDLIFQVCATDNFTASTTPLTWTAGTSMSLADANDLDGFGVQYRTLATAGSITPTLTLAAGTGGAINNMVTVAVAFKGASVGSDINTANVGIRGVISVDTNYNNPAFSPFTCCGNSVTVQVPMMGGASAAIVLAWQGHSSEEPTGVSDSLSNTWTKDGCTLNTGNNNEYCFWYTTSATTSNTQTFTVTHSGAQTIGNFMLWDLFNISAIDSPSHCDAFGNQTTQTGTVTGPSCTPSVTNGIMVGAIQEDGQAVSAVSNGVMENSSQDGYENESSDQDGGFVHYYETSVSAVPFNWTYINTEGAVNIGQWMSRILMFKGPVAAASTSGFSKRLKLRKYGVF